MTSSGQPKTHFGFKTVGEDEKASLVRGVFNSVASRYDLMNDFMSAGLHRLWKNEMAAWLSPRAGWKILDVAGGTGDIAFRLLKRASCEVTVCDINRQMLEEGRNRAIDQNILTGVEFVCGDAETLPFASNSRDAYTIAFGIRNVTHIDRALAEAFRVLKPGGRFLCLEFSHIDSPSPSQGEGRDGGYPGLGASGNPHLDPPPQRGRKFLLQKMYDAYSFAVIPKLGKIVAGNADPYQYLIESIRRFPKQDAFAEMIRAAGFANVQYRNLTGGVVALHSGRKL